MRVTSCKACGKAFEWENKSGVPPKYCSPECRKESYKNRNIVRTDFAKIIGSAFGEWTILDGYFENKVAMVKARCSCGVTRDLIWQNVKQGKSKSCGHRIYGQGVRAIDETGNRYGKLTVLKKVPFSALTPEQQSSKNIFWECKCDCGAKVIASGSRLRFGSLQSCGCTQSFGEEVIAKLLSENGITFSKEIKFKELKSRTYLRFDFGIYSRNELQYLIEFDGIQHFELRTFGAKISEFDDVVFRDKLKNDFCKEQGIPLIRIPYTALKTLSYKDLTLNSRFLLKGE